MKWFINFLSKLFHWGEPDILPDVKITYQTPLEPQNDPVEPITPPNPPKMPNSEKLYLSAKESLGTHMTLNTAVPISVGCAEAVSAVMKDAGISVPFKGIEGTAQMLEWLRSNPIFSEQETSERGSIILSATGTGNGKIRGHVGIVGDHGIMSNESQSGLWKEQWDLDSWDSYYRRYGGIPTHFFKWVD